MEVHVKLLSPSIMDGMLNKNLIAETIGFHGLPLQKSWDEERGSSDLKNMGIQNIDYSVYFTRQKTLTFTDRSKRLRLHQFICKKANLLYEEQPDTTLNRRVARERNAAGRI